MPPKRKTRLQLKKGDNMVVTIEESAADCFIVSMLFQNKKYCGALLDTSKRDGPFGITNFDEQEESKVETRQTQQNIKQSYKIPFPQPLVTRQSYKQDVPQPPLRNIYRRIRRSRRKARLNMLRPSQDNSTKQKSWKFPSHDDNCNYSDSNHSVHQVKTAMKSSVGSKRKFTELPSNKCIKRIKYQDDTPCTSTDESNDESDVPEKLESPIKNLIPRKTPFKSDLQRSPIIKITYKSPGGRGRFIKIPSKLHHSPNKDDIVQVSSLSTRKKNTIVEYKTEEQKRPVKSSHLTDSVNNASTNNSVRSSLTQKRQYIRKNINMITIQEKNKCLQKNKEDIASGTLNVKRKYVKRKFIRKNDILQNDEQSKLVVEVKKKKLSKKLKSTSPVVEIKQKCPPQKVLSNISKSQLGKGRGCYVSSQTIQDTVNSVVEIKKKTPMQKYTKMTSGKTERAMKVLHRAKRSSFLISTDQITDETLSTTAEKNKHLRVVLKPLEEKSKSGSESCANSARDNSIFHSFGFEKSHIKSPSKVAISDSKKDFKKTSPQSHTIYVTRCKTSDGILYAQGDVVWGKLTGYPWWPSRIVKLIVTKTDGEILRQEVMVGWFRSRTTSIIPLHCIQSFEKQFDIRFDKKRKGLYLKAVNDAKNALSEISPEVRKLISQFET